MTISAIERPGLGPVRWRRNTSCNSQFVSATINIKRFRCSAAARLVVRLELQVVNIHQASLMFCCQIWTDYVTFGYSQIMKAKLNYQRGGGASEDSYLISGFDIQKQLH